MPSPCCVSNKVIIKINDNILSADTLEHRKIRLARLVKLIIYLRNPRYYYVDQVNPRRQKPF